MKIDRRSFLSFVIGGAAGTALSPMPWKLIDDSSIWTQNWPWTPVPEKGEVTYVQTTCTLCPGGCGISVRKVEDRVVKIEGAEGHPINDGGICILGLAGPQYLYSPTRIASPMKKEGDTWKKISWSQAINEVAEKLKGMREKQQTHTLACIADAGNGTVPRLFHRFLTAFGSPNFMQPSSAFDTISMALNRMTGKEGDVAYDVGNADYIISFGAGLLEGWGSPVRAFRDNAKRVEAGGKLVQIEPRLSNTAAKADKWLAIKPGTEAILALGLARVIVDHGLNNKDTVGDYAADTLRNGILAGFDSETVAEKTGLRKTDIVSLATDFAKAKRPLALFGRGQGTTPVSLAEASAVQLLNALAGNIGNEGGIWAQSEVDVAEWDPPIMDMVADEGMSKPRLDGAGTTQFPEANQLLNRLPGVVNSGKSYPVEALFVMGANPCYTMADVKAVREAFEKIPFIVSFSSFMDETTALADIILPNHIYLERLEDISTPPGFPRPFIGLSQPVVEPQANTQHAADVLMQIAKAIGGSVAESFPWEDFETCLADTMGEKWEPLVEQGFWIEPNFSPGYPANVMLPGTDLHVEPIRAEGDEGSFPMLLVPYDTMRLANGPVSNMPYMTKTVPDSILKGNDLLVEVNPKTAKTLFMKTGDMATLTTPRGSTRVKIQTFEGVPPDVIAMPRGLGHRGNDPFLSDKGVNYNELAGPVEDPVSGLDAAWGIRAKLAKA